MKKSLDYTATSIKIITKVIRVYRQVNSQAFGYKIPRTSKTYTYCLWYYYVCNIQNNENAIRTGFQYKHRVPFRSNTNFNNSFFSRRSGWMLDIHWDDETGIIRCSFPGIYLYSDAIGTINRNLWCLFTTELFKHSLETSGSQPT